MKVEIVQPIFLQVTSGPITIHCYGSIVNSLDKAIRLCLLTGATVNFDFNGTKHEVSRDELRRTADAGYGQFKDEELNEYIRYIKIDIARSLHLQPI